MKAGIALLAGLLLGEATSQTLKIDVGSCKAEKVVENTAVACSCVGGSGDYDWHYTDLPDGWSYQNDRIVVPKGRALDKKLYGAKVEVLDRRTKQSQKRALFFSFEGGKISQIVDDDYDFSVENLISGNRQYAVSGIQGTRVYGSAIGSYDRFYNIISGVDGIGGGLNLGSLRPYFLGHGLYKGDEYNPYISRLPSDADIDRLLEANDCQQIRSTIVYTVRSRVNCTEISSFLERTLRKLRTRIANYKVDIEEAKKLIIAIEEQLKFLQGQLKEAEASQVNFDAIRKQIDDLKVTITKTVSDRQAFQLEIVKTTRSIDEFQAQIYKITVESKRIKDEDDRRVARIAQIDSNIVRLQEQIKLLTAQKESVSKEREQFSGKLAEVKVRIDAINVKIEAAKVTITELRLKIKKATEDIEISQNKIEDLDRQIRISDNRQRAADIKLKISQLQQRLTVIQGNLKLQEPAYKELNDNYEELLKIGDSNFNGCYKGLFDGNNYEYIEKGDDIEFLGEDAYNQYLGRIFGNFGSSNIRIVGGPVSSTITGGSSVTVGAGLDFSSRLKVRVTNIFSRDWKTAYGSIYDDDTEKVEEDFGCDAASTNVRSFKGRIQSIRRNVAKVIDDRGAECNVYLGGCTRIESAKKELPRAGDEIYWKGSARRGGSSTDYNAQHVSCR